MRITHFDATLQEPCPDGPGSNAVLLADRCQRFAVGVGSHSLVDLLNSETSGLGGAVPFEDDAYCSSFNSVRLRQFALQGACPVALDQLLLLLGRQADLLLLRLLRRGELGSLGES